MAGIKYTPAKRIAKFWERVDKSGGDDSCWLWTRKLIEDGYGRAYWKDKLYLTHRIAYEIAFGEFDQSLEVLHRCDNPACCNPKHLFLGTQEENIRDMVTKGRQWHPSGVKHHLTHLTKADVAEIRATYSPRKVTCAMLAERFHISPSQVSNIVHGHSWKESLSPPRAQTS